MTDELARLAALRAYDILDTPPEPAYDDLARLAAHICQTPMAVITLIDAQRQWFKAQIGMPARETPRADAFCAYTIQHERPLIVEDAARDPRFAGNPLVRGEPGIRFYAGVPLVSSRGARIGALAVIDRTPRRLSAEQLQMLEALARQVMSQFELRLERNQHRLTAAQLIAAQQVGRMGSWELCVEDSALTWSHEIFHIFGIAPAEFEGTFEAFLEFVHPDDRPALLLAQGRALRGEAPLDVVHRVVRADGQVRYVRERAELTRREGQQGTLLVGIVQDITDEHAAEQALRTQQESLRQAQALLRIAGRVGRIGGWAADVQKNEIHWSDEIAGILEWGDVAPTLDDVLDLYPPEWREQVAGAVEACAEQGQPFDIEVEVTTARGRRLWARVAGEAEHDAEGAIRRVVGAFQDISDRKRSESELQRFAARLTATFESMTDAFYMLDRAWVFTYLNREAERVLQRGREELLGRSLWEAWPEARDSILASAYQQAMRQGTPEHFELYSPPLQGWFEVHAYPAAEGLAVYFREITEQKRREAQLAESEERFRLVAQTISHAIWDWNVRDDQIWQSNGMQTLFGYTEVGYQPDTNGWTERIHPDDVARVRDSIYAAIEGDAQEWEEQYRFKREDGTYAQVIDRGFIMRDDQGRAVRMVGGMTDITERLALEEQLRQAQRLEAVGQLTGGVAHDFNNLLTVILGNAELLAEALSHEPQLHALAEMIGGAAQRGADLTRHLLAFARRQALDPQVVDVNLLVARIDRLLRRTLGEHIAIEFVRAPGLWPALVDPAQLESALLNLCLNARDAMPAGGRLTIETANAWLDAAYVEQHIEVQPGRYVMLAVSDTGVGIAPEHLARVFEPFFTTKEKGYGTGLGLSMVYGFVRQSRGHIEITSDVGRGTTVRLYLPRSLLALREGARQAEPRIGGSEVILLVEDDAQLRQYAQLQLESLGYTVVVAADGPQALALVESRADIVLLFTDVVMPGGMSGRALAEAARLLRPRLRVLYTSGYTENAIVHHGQLDPGVHLLAKPYRRADLARKVREALAGDDTE